MDQEFLAALSQLEREKGISKEVVLEALEAALISAYRKNFRFSQNVRVDIDRQSGQIRVFAKKKIVDDVLDPRVEISFDAAKKIDVNCKVNDMLELEVTPSDFGRIAAQTAKQVITQRIREAEKLVIFKEYEQKVGDILIGVVRRFDKRCYYVDLGKIEAILPYDELILKEKFNLNSQVKAYVTSVEMSNKGPFIYLSRKHQGFLKRLLELEIPEIYEGLVEIHNIAREAGFRSKIAVYSKSEDIDPVGSCIGNNGFRIKAISKQLHNEKIDIIKWSKEIDEFIVNSLNPAKVLKVLVNEEMKEAKVIVADEQLSLAIGRDGQNVRLAAKLTGFRIDIKAFSSFKDSLGGTKFEKEVQEN